MVSYLIRCLLLVQNFFHIYLLKVHKYLIFYLKKIMSIFDLFFFGYVLSYSDFGILFDSQKKKKKEIVYDGISMPSHSWD